MLWLLFGEGDMLVAPPRESRDEENFPNLFSEQPNNPPNVSEIEKYSNLNPLNEGRNIAQSRINNGNQVDAKSIELQMEIEKMRKNPRKVVQITVYYDDSTFETFYPGK